MEVKVDLDKKVEYKQAMKRNNGGRRNKAREQGATASRRDAKRRRGKTPAAVRLPCHPMHGRLEVEDVRDGAASG